MLQAIEDYAMIGDCHSAALVGRNGSIDWFCFPRFDSPACFAALLGDARNGRWLLAPAQRPTSVRRRYRPNTLILETDYVLEEGTVRLIDFMPLSDDRQDIVRIVEGVSGDVDMVMELIVRFDYGSIMPWVRKTDDALLIGTGPLAVELRSPVDVTGEDMKTVARFRVRANQRISFSLNCRRSYETPNGALDRKRALTATDRSWQAWSEQCTYQGRWYDAVIRSLITLKGLSYAPTGGIVAAATTSLPERIGGERNWDYRYCWLRDATFTLNAMLVAGYRDEAIAWREWLQRAVGGPQRAQVLYSITGERRLHEQILDWLPGYAGMGPVRIGNAASEQLQLDVYGEVMDTLHLARTVGLEPNAYVWQIQRSLLDFLEENWTQPDEGIWEVRGPRQHFTHSKMMAWVAFDRAVKDVERFGQDGPVERWREIRHAIHEQICDQGFDMARNTFVQAYGSDHLDASLLLMPQVGFLPPDDPRVRGTVQAIQDGLVVDGLVRRYSTTTHVDALPPGEGTFLPCSFWLADALIAIGKREEGEALFKRLLALRNDVGLLSEEYEHTACHMLGNFPQALTHMALINTACHLSISDTRAQQSYSEGERPTAAGQAPELHDPEAARAHSDDRGAEAP